MLDTPIKFSSTPFQVTFMLNLHINVPISQLVADYGSKKTRGCDFAIFLVDGVWHSFTSKKSKPPLVKLTYCIQINLVDFRNILINSMRKYNIGPAVHNNIWGLSYILLVCFSPKFCSIPDCVWASKNLVGPVVFKSSLARGPVQNNANVAACTRVAQTPKW